MSSDLELHRRLTDTQAQIKELERKLANAEGNLRIFIKQSPMAIALFDTNMNYLEVSDKYLEDYKITDDIIGENHYQVFPNVPASWRAVHQRCLQGVEEYCEEDAFEWADGSKLYIDWIVKPWYTEKREVGGLILIAEKVNERVEAKQKLLKLNQELKQSNQKLEEFAYAVSHHLQEPLKSTLNDAEMIRDFLQGAEDEKLKEHADSLLTHTRRMQQMIKGLLEYARMGKQKGFHNVDISQILGQVLDNMKLKIRERNVKVLYGVLPVIRANEFEMLALFQNLIANGIKYNESAEIEIVVAAENKGIVWEFAVRDNGIGIPKEDQADIFNLFRRLELDKQYEGTGIGLPICKRIVESLGGQIWMDSKEGIGTTIYFTLSH